MSDISQWLDNGKEWIFSGIGTTVISCIVSSIFSFIFGWKANTIITKTSNKQSAKSRDHSPIYQSGGAMNVSISEENTKTK